jgi:sigma-B regulation protein RsbU (phosphoserine phosphatase)
MARLTFWTFAFGALLWIIDQLVPGGVPRVLWFVFWVASLGAGVYYLGRLTSLFRHRVLWKLSRRLIVTYVFIGVIPVILIGLFLVTAAIVINGQLGSYLVLQRLRGRVDELHQLDRALIHELRLSSYSAPEDLLLHVQRLFETQFTEHCRDYPALAVTVRLGSRSQSFLCNGAATTDRVLWPAWLVQEEFAGIVWDQHQLALRAAERRGTPMGDLFVILSEPFTSDLLDQVGAGIGPVAVLSAPPTVNQQAAVHSVHVPAPPSLFRMNLGFTRLNLDLAVFGGSALAPIAWEAPQPRHRVEVGGVYVTSRLLTLNRQLFTGLGEFSGVLPMLLVIIAVVFLVIELFALVIGIRLTQSITGTVDQLQAATERVRVGDFSYRIGMPARDQLSGLAEAFDGMTASVERLLIESQEKLRLESELEIAREVQNQLFPQISPEIAGLKLFGACRAARVVSGDYYDFLRLDDDRCVLVLGDISGKGISAALLMAAIQSSLHAQFYDGIGGRPAQVSVSEVVSRLNRQLCSSTPTEKYATFFFAMYDGRTRELNYTNAGHLPPALFRRNRVERLETGGTVVGLFVRAEYEEATVRLESGDVLLAFTDGLTEPENSYGQAFGEDRLIEVTRKAANFRFEEISAEIYRSVSDWTGSPDLQDDMTLILGRAV